MDYSKNMNNNADNMSDIDELDPLDPLNESNDIQNTNNTEESRVIDVSSGVMLLLLIKFPDLDNTQLFNGMMLAMREIADGRMYFDEISDKARVNRDGDVYYDIDDNENDCIVRHIC